MRRMSVSAAPFWRAAALLAAASLWAHLVRAQPTVRDNSAAIQGSAIYQRAFAFLTQHRTEEALELVKQLNDKIPAQQAERLAIEAWADFVQGRFDAAEDKARGALMLAAEQPLASILSAQLFASEGSIIEAAASALAAARADPNNPVILWRAQEVLGVTRQEPRTRLELLERLITLGGSPELQKPLDAAREALAVAKKLDNRPTDLWSDQSARRADFTLVTDPTRRTLEVDCALPNGARNRWRLDSGAFLPVLTQRTAAAFDKELLTAANPAAARSADRVWLPRFALGELRWESVLAAEVPAGRDLLPILLFHNSLVALDLKQQRLSVFTQREAFEKEWAQRLKRAAPLRYRTFGGAIVMSCSLRSDGAKETRGAVILSTGLPESQFSMKFAERWQREMNVAIEMPSPAAAANTPVSRPLLSNLSVRLGNLSFSIARQPLFNQEPLQQALGFDFAGVVGMNFLSNCEFLIFDVSNRTVYFGPPLPRN